MLGQFLLPRRILHVASALAWRQRACLSRVESVTTLTLRPLHVIALTVC
jgi:hypothetical protein